MTVKTHHFNSFCEPHRCRTPLISSPKSDAYPDEVIVHLDKAHLVVTALGWVQHPQLCCWLFSWGSVRSCLRPNGVWHGVLETAQAWVLQAACKYLLSPIKPNPKAGASNNGLKPLLCFMFLIHSTWWAVCAVQLAAVCQIPQDLSLAPTNAFTGAQGLTSGSGWTTKSFINPGCLGSPAPVN